MTPDQRKELYAKLKADTSRIQEMFKAADMAARKFLDAWKAHEARYPFQRSR